jgi:hypothetical protein
MKLTPRILCAAAGIVITVLAGCASDEVSTMTTTETTETHVASPTVTTETRTIER